MAQADADDEFDAAIGLRERMESGSAPNTPPAASDTSSLVVSDLGSVLGPPLDFLPKDIEPNELYAYRADYQAFRAGQATGAHGEIASLCASQREQKLKDAWTTGTKERKQYKTAKKRFRLVPLIGVNLASSSAAQSAGHAAKAHLKEMDIMDHLLSGGRQESGEESGPDKTGARLQLEAGEKRQSPSKKIQSILRQSSAPAYDFPARQGSKDFPSRQNSWLEGRRASQIDLEAQISEEEAQIEEFEEDEDAGVDIGSLSPLPWQRGTSTVPVTSKPGMGLFMHIMISMICLIPCLLGPGEHWYGCLWLPGSYATYVLLAALRAGLNHPGSSGRLAQVLRMERLLRERRVPLWFPDLASAVYVGIALLLALGRSFQNSSGTRRIVVWNPAPERHDYNCWGSDTQEVADCVMIRHSACTMLASFYTCLLVIAVCNRSVKGANIVAEHQKSLEELFPVEAPSLLSYVERSVDSNAVYWRNSRRHKAQSIALSLAWTLMSYGVYTELLQDSQTKLAQAVFLVSLPCTYALQYTLLRHVLLSVILLLEGIKARAAAMAYCDEEGVLPFTSAHAIYVWFSVRRNVQAQNEVAYQNSAPVFAASLLCAAACSCWVISELSHRGMSVFTLTSRGGASLMVVASACVSSIFVGIFLSTLLDIGKLEEAHARQLRIAHLRLEHGRSLKKVQGRRQVSSDRESVQGGSHSSSITSSSVMRTRHRVSSDLEAELDKIDHNLDDALAMIERVIMLLEHHDVKPTIFGVEIGTKPFQGVYAALLANLWYLCVWGVLIPLMSYHDEADKT